MFLKLTTLFFIVQVYENNGGKPRWKFLHFIEHTFSHACNYFTINLSKKKKRVRRQKNTDH